MPGIDDRMFQTAAEQAKDGCIVSKALQGNVQLSVSTKLHSRAA